MTDYSPEQIAKIAKACDIAGVNYPDFEQTKEWMLGLAEVAQEYEASKTDPDEDEGAYEIADREVPYMTYRLWLIWTDLQLYTKWEDEVGEGFEYSNNVEEIPQVACYEIAVRVLNGWPSSFVPR